MYRRRPNNSKKKRRTDVSPPEPEELSGGDPSPVDGDDESNHYPCGNQELTPVVDELFSNGSSIPSHGSYSPYPYPQPTSHRTHHMSLHQQHQQHDFSNPTPRSANNGSLSLSLNPSAHSHSQSSLRSAPVYSSDYGNSYQSSSPSLTGAGNGYHVPAASQNHGYWNGYHDRESTHSPHHNLSTSPPSNATVIQGSMNAHWLPPPVPSSNPQYSQYSGRERAYTTTALPAMKSSFPSPGMNQMQLPLPPMMTSGARVGGRRPSSGGYGSHGGGGQYLPSFFSSNAPATSPSASSSGGHGYFPSPPSTASSTSTGTINGGDRIMTPPDLGSFDLARPHPGEISVGYNSVWDRKQ